MKIVTFFPIHLHFVQNIVKFNNNKYKYEYKTSIACRPKVFSFYFLMHSDGAKSIQIAEGPKHHVFWNWSSAKHEGLVGQIW